MNKEDFKNQALYETYCKAKEKGYSCYTFASSGKIEQIFYENKHGHIGTASAHFGGVTFSTVHKSKRGSGYGAGFRVSDDIDNPANLDAAFTTPVWARRYKVEKYKNWEEYISRNTILEYYAI